MACRSSGCRAAAQRRRQGPAWLGLRHVALLQGLLRAGSHPREIFHMLRIEDAAARLIARARHRRGAQSFRLARGSGRQPRGPGHGHAARDQPARHRRSGAVRPRIRPPTGSRLRRQFEAPVPDSGAGSRRHLVHAIRGRRCGRAARQGGDDRQGGRHRAISSGPDGRRSSDSWESRDRWCSRSAICSGARASR